MSEVIVGKTRVRMKWGRNKGQVGVVKAAHPEQDQYYIDFNRMLGTQDGDFPDAYWSRSSGFDVIDKDGLYEKRSITSTS